MTVNPLGTVFSIVALAAVVLYVLWFAWDRGGVPSQTSAATVVEKVHNPSGTTYVSTIVGKQNLVQARETPESFVLVLKVGEQDTSAVVEKSFYDQVQIGDSVQITFRQSRFRKTIWVDSVQK